MAAFTATVDATKQRMMADPEHALASALAAVAIARRLPPSHEAQVALVTAEWLHGEALLFLNKLPEATPIVERTLREAERVAPDTKLHGDLLRSQGAIAASSGQVLQALRDYQRAHEVFRAAGVQRSQALALQDIGQIYWDAGDYPRALDYYGQSAEVYSGDPSLNLTTHNNRAEVFRKLHRYPEAAAAYRAALTEARKLQSPLLQTRILTNLAGSEAEAGHLTVAQAAADQALRLAAHGEAAGWKPYAYGAAARIALDEGRLDRAGELIATTFAGVDLAHSEMLFRDYHATAARIYELRGDEAQALAHLKAFQRLDSEAQALTASAASQLTAARFDFTNQNYKISRLKQGQLESAVQLERGRGRLQSLALSAVAIIAALLGAGFVSLRRSRNAIRATNVELERALKAKTDFLATTSHEIRTPLNGILGMTQIMLAGRKLAPELRDQIEVVHGAGETMKALVDDILDIAKMETGDIVVAREPTRVATILEETERLWRGHAEGKGLTLTLAVQNVPTLIRCDPTRLRQVVFNLVSNAVKFTASGTVAIAAHGDGDTLTIEIADTGIGIPADQLDLIFEPFHQVDGGTTRRFGGTGLGLAICRNIVAAMGGDIAVTSDVGHGTRFTLRLPLIAIDAVAGPAPAPGERRDGVLLVEGNPLTQGVLRSLLERRSPTLTIAACGDSALAAIASGNERQLLIEAKSALMADREPLASLATLIAAGRAAGMRVLVLLAPCAELDVDAVRALGADQLVLKPVTGAGLLGFLDVAQSISAEGAATRAAA
ncbi:ATP-binding protein [Sphingomonas sp.]|uniref:tetratricopeptide repeat-containing sensor histidine kinase n=1 Tax=Sphingomonas sp. TaxID=28214 RepID=UPI003B00F0FB